MRKTICEICGEYDFVDRHHIVSKAFGGNNKPYNIVTVCPNCHRKIHAGQIKIFCKMLTTKGYEILIDQNMDVTDHQFVY